MSDATGPQLDADALDLLDAFREQEQIPRALHDRVWDRVAADVTGTGDGDSATPARWARRGAVIGLLAAAAVAVLWWGGRALSLEDGGVSGNQAEYDRSDTPPGGVAEPRQPEQATRKSTGSDTPPAPAVTADEPEPIPQAADETTPTASASTPVARPSRGQPSRRVTSSTPPPSTPAVEPAPVPSDTLAEENRLLGRARAALIAESPEQALTLLREHARRFPDGVLAQERQALRAVALCEAGHEGEGTKAARAFLRAHPQAALARRVRSACPE